MRISFRTDKNLRKLFFIYQLGAPGAITRAMWDYPSLFGERLENAVKIYNKYIRSRRYENRVWYALTSNNNPRIIGANEYSDLLRLLGGVKGDLLEDNDNSFRELSSGISKAYKKNAKKIEKHVMAVFGFEMPKEATVILSETGSPGSVNGGAPSSNKKDYSVIFGMGIGEGNKNNFKIILGVFVHEILHRTIDMNGTLKEGKRGERDRARFEEAVLDYFVPDGMLSEKVGLIKKREIEDYKRRMNLNRPDSKEISNQLLEHIKEYDKSYGKETIWKFLAKRGFARYINQK
ncbi:MAG: hypothetical protein KGH59_02190 [Candidatus Micrarchaeota archaeon]|nr:hypothetical protein [Candidatus Micrarchaeota archaeon]